MLLHPHVYANECWWCGMPAASGEHVFKKGDLVRDFGRRYVGPDEVVLIRGGGPRDSLQGPNSNFVKFPDFLCATCNNARSQPFDTAYDQLVKYVATHERLLLRRRMLDLRAYSVPPGGPVPPPRVGIS